MTANIKIPGPLSDRQHEKFAHGLAEFLSQEDAYGAAGYVPDRGNAARLAARPEIKARVCELVDEATAFANVRRARIIVELDRVGRANMADYFESVRVNGKWTSQLKPLSKLTRDQTAAIEVYENDPKTGVVEIKLKDSLAANTTLLKYLGGLPEAPASPSFNIFNVLSSDDQRALADALETCAARGQPL